MKTRDYRIWIATVLAVLLASVGACNCNGSTSEAADKDQEATAESASASEEGGDDESGSDQGEAPPKDLYPGMNFGKLGDDDRRTFVSIAKAELCPCDGANASLHACLEKQDGQCALAKRAATVIASGIESGADKTDILDRLATFVEKAKKVHEFDLKETPRKGPADASVKVVEFADFQCPHCKRASSVMDEIHKSYGDKVAIYFKHFPLSGHGKARTAARAAVAAQIQGKFWPMHDLLFEHQRSLTKSKIQSFARRLGLNFSKFKKDMASKQVAKAVESDRQEGANAEIKGTPAIFVNGRRHIGGLSKKQISAVIDSELDAAESGEKDEPTEEKSDTE